MAVIKQRIGNLVGGVSQQTPEMRLENQCTEQVNCWNDLVTGMRKRPNTTTVGKLDIADPESVLYHTHAISNKEQYIVSIGKGGLQVFDAKTAEACEVRTKQEYLDYLKTDAEPEDLPFLPITLGDDVFILNKTKLVTMDSVVVEPPVTDIQMLRTWRFEMAQFGESAEVGDSYTIVINGRPYKGYGEVESISGSTNIPISRTPDKDADQLLSDLRTEYPTILFRKLDATTIRSEAYITEEVSVVSTVPEWLDYSYELTDGVFQSGHSGVVYIKQPDYMVEYEVNLKVNGVKYRYSYTTPEGKDSGMKQYVQTSYILERLIERINEDTSSHHITAVLYSKNLMVLVQTEGTKLEWSVTADDDLSGDAIVGFRDVITNENDLPPKAPEGYLVEVRGTGDTDSYYMEYRKTERTDDGYWAESVKKSIPNKIDASTMPHILKRYPHTESGKPYFTFEPYTWADRKVGDMDTCPEPSFINKKISTISLLQGRLVFVSGNDVVMSEVNNDENFWLTSVIAEVESDPVDISLNSNEALDIRALTADNEMLILWDDNVQMGLQFDGVSWTANQISNYNVDLNAAPARIGNMVYYSGYTLGATQLNTYYRQRDQLYESMDTTSHAPNYIKVRPKYIAGNSVDSYLALCSSTNNEVYVYNYRSSGADLVQSAWSKWTVGDAVYYVHDVNGTLLMVVKRDDGVHLECMDFIQTNTVMLDAMTVSDEKPKAINGRETVKHKGKWYQGVQYDQTYTFSPLYLRFNNVPQTEEVLMLRKVTLNYSNSVRFTLQSERNGVIKEKSTGYARTLPTLLSGDVEYDTGELSLVTKGKARDINLSIINTSPYDCNITSVVWMGAYTKRTR